MRLFDQYPRPWRIVQDESIDPDKYASGYEVFDANGKTVMYGGTFTGDGDAIFDLDRWQVAELVEIVNKAP